VTSNEDTIAQLVTADTEVYKRAVNQFLIHLSEDFGYNSSIGIVKDSSYAKMNDVQLRETIRAEKAGH